MSEAIYWWLVAEIRREDDEEVDHIWLGVCVCVCACVCGWVGGIQSLLLNVLDCGHGRHLEGNPDEIGQTSKSGAPFQQLFIYF